MGTQDLWVRAEPDHFVCVILYPLLTVYRDTNSSSSRKSTMAFSNPDLKGLTP